MPLMPYYNSMLPLSMYHVSMHHVTMLPLPMYHVSMHHVSFGQNGLWVQDA